MNFFEAKKFVEENDIDLDDAVYDLKAEEASSINNEGVDEQIRYLIQSGFTKHDLLALKP